MKLENRKWTEEELFEVRKEVLAQWETGKEVEDLEANIEYTRNQPWYKFFSKRDEQARRENKTLLEPMVGMATFEFTKDHVDYDEKYEPEGWVLFTSPYERKCRFDLSKSAMERSYAEGRSLVSGYPLVVSGLERARKINEATKAAIFHNSSDEDARLQVEFALAAGFTSYASHPLNEVTQHSKNCPPDKKLLYSQYLDRLAAYYTEHGATISACCAANYSGWDAPGYKVTTVVLQGILAATQGVKDIDTEMGLSLNLIQDVAALKVIRRLLRECLDRLGYKDVDIASNIFPYLGSWPRDREGAATMIAWNYIIPVLAGCEWAILKSLDEALYTPTKFGNEASLKICRQLRMIMGTQRMPESPELSLEEEMLEKEARATIDKVFELGDGDITMGIIKGFETGVLDTIYSPWKYLKQNVLIVRDCSGAIRYLKYGNIPLPKEVVEYHRQKIAMREKEEKKKADLDMMIDDVVYASRSILERADLAYYSY